MPSDEELGDHFSGYAPQPQSGIRKNDVERWQAAGNDVLN